MTIYFCGQDFKYEIEGVCKLFFPLVRFTHVYNAPETAKDSADYVHTLRRREEAETLLRVAVQTAGFIYRDTVLRKPVQLLLVCLPRHHHKKSDR